VEVVVVCRRRGGGRAFGGDRLTRRCWLECLRGRRRALLDLLEGGDAAAAAAVATRRRRDAASIVSGGRESGWLGSLSLETLCLSSTRKREREREQRERERVEAEFCFFSFFFLFSFFALPNLSSRFLSPPRDTLPPLAFPPKAPSSPPSESHQRWPPLCCPCRPRASPQAPPASPSPVLLPAPLASSRAPASSSSGTLVRVRSCSIAPEERTPEQTRARTVRGGGGLLN